jgi:hypothetical protein
MQRLEVSGAVRPLYGSLGVKGLSVRYDVMSHRPSVRDLIIVIIIIIIIIYLTANGLSPVGSGYYACT